MTVVYKNHVGATKAIQEKLPSGPKAELAHWHSIGMAGKQFDLPHVHLVDLETPEHIHPVTKGTSYGRFIIEHLRGAQRQAGVKR